MIRCDKLKNNISPDPPIPTAFEVCISVEQQILWLQREVKRLNDRVTALEQNNPS